MALIGKLNPDVVAVVSSGYSQEPVLALHEEHGFDLILQEPRAGLVRAVAQDRMRGQESGST